MKKTTVVSLFILMVLSFSMPSYAGFVVHQTSNRISLSTSSVSDGKPDTKTPKKKTGVFGIVAICAGAVGCFMPAGVAILAILLGIAAGVFGIMGMSKKKRKLRGLAIAGFILGIIAIVGGIILL